MTKLTDNQRHMMRLIIKGRDAEGWAKVSKVLLPLVQKMREGAEPLVEVEAADDGSGRARLTANGEMVLLYT